MKRIKWVLPAMFFVIGLSLLFVSLQKAQGNTRAQFVFPQSSHSIVYYLETDKFSFLDIDGNLIIKKDSNNSITIPNYEEKVANWEFSESSELIAPKSTCELLGIQVNLDDDSVEFPDNIEKLFCTLYNSERIEEII